MSQELAIARIDAAKEVVTALIERSGGIHQQQFRRMSDLAAEAFKTIYAAVQEATTDEPTED